MVVDIISSSSVPCACTQRPKVKKNVGQGRFTKVIPKARGGYDEGASDSLERLEAFFAQPNLEREFTDKEDASQQRFANESVQPSNCQSQHRQKQHGQGTRPAYGLAADEATAPVLLHGRELRRHMRHRLAQADSPQAEPSHAVLQEAEQSPPGPSSTESHSTFQSAATARVSPKAQQIAAQQAGSGKGQAAQRASARASNDRRKGNRHSREGAMPEAVQGTGREPTAQAAASRLASRLPQWELEAPALPPLSPPPLQLPKVHGPRISMPTLEIPSWQLLSMSSLPSIEMEAVDMRGVSRQLVALRNLTSRQLSNLQAAAARAAGLGQAQREGSSQRQALPAQQAQHEPAQAGGRDRAVLRRGLQQEGAQHAQQSGAPEGRSAVTAPTRGAGSVAVMQGASARLRQTVHGAVSAEQVPDLGLRRWKEGGITSWGVGVLALASLVLMAALRGLMGQREFAAQQAVRDAEQRARLAQNREKQRRRFQRALQAAEGFEAKSSIDTSVFATVSRKRGSPGLLSPAPSGPAAAEGKGGAGLGAAGAGRELAASWRGGGGSGGATAMRAGQAGGAASSAENPFLRGMGGLTSSFMEDLNELEGQQAESFWEGEAEDEEAEAQDVYDPEAWDQDTRRAWDAFVAGSKVGQGKLWDAQDVDSGLPAIQVDLNKE